MYRPYVCLSQSQCVQTWSRESSWDILEVTWFGDSKVKGQGHRVNNTTQWHFILNDNRASFTFARWRYWQDQYGVGSNSMSTLSDRTSRYRLRSTASRQLFVPPAKLSTYGRRAFASSGPRIWNSLPDYLKDSKLSTDIFKRYLKTYFSLAIRLTIYSTL